jgi:membrane-associated PAP2 superfamily phosphatase
MLDTAGSIPSEIRDPGSPAMLSPWLAVGPALLLAVLVLVDTAPIDFLVESWFYQPGVGFVGRHVWLIETIMHDFLKKAVMGFALLVALAWLLTWSHAKWQRWRRPLGYLVVAIGCASAVVTPLKALTKVHCPWDLEQFGGRYAYVHVGGEAPSGQPEGHCWPAGHAASGFSLLALFFFLRDRRPRLARQVLWAVLLFGSLLGFGRMTQGAHFLSHTVATGLIDWLICLTLYRLLLYRAASCATTGGGADGKWRQGRLAARE